MKRHGKVVQRYSPNGLAARQKYLETFVKPGISDSISYIKANCISPYNATKAHSYEMSVARVAERKIYIKKTKNKFETFKQNILLFLNANIKICRLHQKHLETTSKTPCDILRYIHLYNIQL